MLVEPVTLIEDALVLPPRKIGGRGLRPGVVDAAGSPVVDALGFSGGRPVQADFEDRSKLAIAERCEGTWLYGGLLFSHFGHFLFGSTSRHWAVDALRDQIEGIVFVGPRPVGGLSDGLLRGT